MPNRLIKESALGSEDLSVLSNGAERLFWRLIVVADDFGRFDAAPQVIKARCFPRLVDKLSTDLVEKWMRELTPRLVRYYSVLGRPYGVFRNWLKHQQKRANKSKFPDPPEDEQLQDDSNRNQLQSNVLGIEIEIGSEIEIEIESTPPKLTPSAAPRKAENPSDKFEPLVKLAVQIGGRDEDARKRLVQWTLSMVRQLHGEPEARVLAVTRICLETFKRKVEQGYQISSMWGLLNAIFKAERTKYIQGPENEAHKSGPIPDNIRKLMRGIG